MLGLPSAVNIKTVQSSKSAGRSQVPDLRLFVASGARQSPSQMGMMSSAAALAKALRRRRAGDLRQGEG